MSYINLQNDLATYSRAWNMRLLGCAPQLAAYQLAPGKP